MVISRPLPGSVSRAGSAIAVATLEFDYLRKINDHDGTIKKVPLSRLCRKQAVDFFYVRWFCVQQSH
jgi:hypothetical protein